MTKNKPWGTVDLNPGHYIFSFQGRVFNWVYKPHESIKKAKPVSPGEGEYAKSAPGLKLHLRTKRRERTFSKLLFSLSWRPCWLISCVYPYDQALDITPDRLKSDLAYLGDRFRSYYYNGYGVYQVDYSDKSMFHLHFLVRCGKYPKPKKRGRKRPSLKCKMREWWESRVGFADRHLVNVQHLPTEMDSHAACSYLVRGDKLKDHVRVTSFMGKRHTFGCFNKKNLKFVSRKRSTASPEIFSEIRKIVCFDVHTDSERSDGSYLSDHENKILHAGSGYHIINDPDLEKRVRRKLKELKGGK